MHYYVVGVNGSGKTSLLKVISEETGIAIVHGTTELMNYLGIPGNYNALRALNQAQVLMKWGETAVNLLDQFGDTPFLVDTHILNLTKGAIIRRDGDWIRKYDAIVLIKAQPAIILKRVKNDASKDRALFPDGANDDEKLSLLDIYQQETEKLFNELAALYNLPSLIINNDASIEAGADAFVNSPIYR